MEATEPKKPLSTTEAAVLLGITRQAVTAACKRGDLPSQKIGNTYIIAPDDLANYKPATHSERGKRGMANRWGSKDSANEIDAEK
jgi:excisionase family DNA binding protein